MENINKPVETSRQYKIFRDILTLILIPLTLGIISNRYSKKKEQIDRQIAMTEIIVNKVSGDPIDRDLALELVSLIDYKYSNQLKGIISINLIKRYVFDFSSGDSNIRVNAVKNLKRLYKSYPDIVIAEMFNILDEPEKMNWAVTISFTSTLFLIGEWNGTIEQQEKLKDLKNNRFYSDTTCKVKEYLDGALNNMIIE